MYGYHDYYRINETRNKILNSQQGKKNMNILVGLKQCTVVVLKMYLDWYSSVVWTYGSIHPGRRMTPKKWDNFVLR